MKKLIKDLVEFFDLNKKEKIFLDEFKQIFSEKKNIFDLIFHENQNLHSKTDFEQENYREKLKNKILYLE